MYIPRHFHFVFPVLTSLAGWYITEHYANTYDVVIVFIVIQYHAVMHSAYLYAAGKMYQGYVTRTPKAEEPIINWHTGQPVEQAPPMSDPGFIPLTRKVVRTEPVMNQQVVEFPRFDKERNFAVTLIRMYEFNPETVDLTQAKWVKSGKFVRAEFVAMLDNWQSHGLIIRKSEKRNAPYIVGRWDAVRLVAQGNPLPPPPR